VTEETGIHHPTYPPNKFYRKIIILLDILSDTVYTIFRTFGTFRIVYNMSDAFIDNVVKTASEFADSVGISSVSAQIYALLYISPSALSLDEISAKLNLSKSTVSQNIRILESWDAVKNIFVKGSRKDYYEVNPNIMEIILKKLKNGINSRMNKASANLGEIETLIGNIEDGNKKEFYHQRLNNLKKIYQTVTTLITMLPEKM